MQSSRPYTASFCPVPRTALAACLGLVLSQPVWAGSLGDWAMAAGLDSKLEVSLGEALWSGFSLSRPLDTAASANLSSLTESHHRDWQYQDFKPSLSWQAGDSLRLAAGVDVLHAESRVDGELHASMAPASTDSWQSRYRLGLSYSPSEQTQLDWHYRAAPSTSHGGETALGADEAPLLFVRDGQDLASTSLGFTHTAGERWTLLGQYTRFETAEFASKRLDEQGDADELWRPSWSLTLGSEYRFDPQWSLRGGLQYSQDMRAELNGDTTRFALGAAYRSSNRLSVEMAYTHELIRQQSLSLNSDSVRIDKSDSTGHRFGLGLRYAF